MNQQTPASQAPKSNAAGSDSRIDPVTGLARMTQAAGAGLGDYAEVSRLAVASLILGVMSWLSWFSAILLLVPALALVLGLWAIVVIRRSDGTQTGVAAAIGGMVLAAVLGGYAASDRFAEFTVRSADTTQINQTLDTFAAALNRRDFSTAVGLLDPEFQRIVTPADLRDAFNLTELSRYGTAIVGLRHNRVTLFEGRRTDSPRFATTMLVVSTAGDEGGDPVEQALRLEIRLRYDRESGWAISRLPEMINDRQLAILRERAAVR